jgi:hypothetical protein
VISSNIQGLNIRIGRDWNKFKDNKGTVIEGSGGGEQEELVSS